MLNNKLVKAILLGIAFLSMLAVVNANSPLNSKDNGINQTGTRFLSFDSSLLRILGNYAHDENAPVIRMHKQAVGFASEYIEDNGFLLKKLKEKNGSYFTIMDSVFSKSGLPQELKYLAIIESKLNTRAVSKAGAVGAWQLMPVAARMYSLRVGGTYDERKHFYKSTIAASKLLKDLYKKFDDWLLVIAAYNCGPGGVYKAIKKAGSRNYWKLQHFLPKETRAHVKKFISTHHYYEQKGSITTLTRDDVTAYRKILTEYIDQQNRNLVESMMAVVPEVEDIALLGD